MQILLLSLILVGLISAKTRMIDEHTRNSLSDLILNIFLPCTVVSSFLNTDSSKLKSLGVILVFSTGLMVFCFVLSRLLYRKFGSEQKKVLLYATVVSNASFVGNPVIESVYGLSALVYSSVYLIPLRIGLWTMGIAIFAGTRGSIKKAVFHPCLVATYIGFLILLTGFNPPVLLYKIITTLANCTTPLSMLVVGSILGLVEAKKIITGTTLYYSLIRLICIPLIALGVMYLIHPDPVVTGVAVILSGTPAPVTTAILASKYKSDNVLAGRIVFASTLFSIVTMPALLWLLQAVM